MFDEKDFQLLIDRLGIQDVVRVIWNPFEVAGAYDAATHTIFLNTAGADCKSMLFALAHEGVHYVNAGTGNELDVVHLMQQYLSNRDMDAYIEGLLDLEQKTDLQALKIIKYTFGSRWTPEKDHKLMGYIYNSAGNLEYMRERHKDLDTEDFVSFIKEVLKKHGDMKEAA